MVFSEVASLPVDVAYELSDGKKLKKPLHLKGSLSIPHFSNLQNIMLRAPLGRGLGGDE